MNISKPVLLEQLAEEVCELGQAALKLARKIRGESPTPKTEEELIESLTEEIADVEVCVDQLTDLIDFCQVESIKEFKYQRWMKRLEDDDKAKSKQEP